MRLRFLSMIEKETVGVHTTREESNYTHEMQIRIILLLIFVIYLFISPLDNNPFSNTSGADFRIDWKITISM